VNPKPLARVLVVDDSQTQAMDVRLHLVRLGFDVRIALSGAEALRLLEADRSEIVLTDLVMPEMDGLELVRRVRAARPGVPVILMTGQGSEEIAVEALKQGAADYVPKQHRNRDLPRVLENVLAIARAHRVKEQVLDCLTHTESRFILDNDATLIPPLIGRLQDNLARLKLCDENARMRVAMALREALLNAIEHGNLEVSSELREREDDLYYRLSEERRRQAPFNQRHVHVAVHESRDEARYVIRDEGPGFDPSKLPDPTDPENLERASGRGLLLIRSFMDEVEHNSTGNEITLVKRRD
jgi:DNA-binding response OmpR family regulator